MRLLWTLLFFPPMLSFQNSNISLLFGFHFLVFYLSHFFFKTILAYFHFTLVFQFSLKHLLFIFILSLLLVLPQVATRMVVFGLSYIAIVSLPLLMSCQLWPSFWTSSPMSLHLFASLGRCLAYILSLPSKFILPFASHLNLVTYRVFFVLIWSNALLIF